MSESTPKGKSIPFEQHLPHPCSIPPGARRCPVTSSVGKSAKSKSNDTVSKRLETRQVLHQQPLINSGTVISLSLAKPAAASSAAPSASNSAVNHSSPPAGHLNDSSAVPVGGGFSSLPIWCGAWDIAC